MLTSGSWELRSTSLRASMNVNMKQDFCKLAMDSWKTKMKTEPGKGCGRWRKEGEGFRPNTGGHRPQWGQPEGQGVGSR